jgi:antagonist of KipI
MSYVDVIRPGLLTTVQDSGRWGHQASGVSVSGAMDIGAHRAANARTGNSAACATLEVTLVGPELEFADERIVSIAGARFALEIDGRMVDPGPAFEVHAGSRVRFGPRISGARAYLAVSGGFDVPLVLGSRSTHLPSAMGGNDGRALRAGDRLPLGAFAGRSRWAVLLARSRNETAQSVPGELSRPQPRPVRVVEGPDRGEFSDEAFAALVGSVYTIAADSNRMGYRLAGASIVHRPGPRKLSDVTPRGTIQILPTGQLVVLMADCQTTGGYPALANVITADLDVAAQLAPGETMRFRVCSPEEALEALVERERRLQDIERVDSVRDLRAGAAGGKGGV